MEIPTLHGPLYGVEGTDSYDVALPVLQYVNEAAGPGALRGWSNAPCFDVWEQAHASNNWDDARSQWPSLREKFKANLNGGWPAFGQASLSPLRPRRRLSSQPPKWSQACRAWDFGNGCSLQGLILC